MKRIISMFVIILIFGLIVNPALATGNAVQQTKAG